MTLSTFSGRPASQRESEINALIGLMKETGCTSYLEIGARHGDTFHYVMSSLPAGSKGVAVDLPGGLWGHKSSLDCLKSVCDDLTSHDIHLILGDSTSKDIISKVREKGLYDCILIDGNHLYDGVKADWDNYFSFANKLIAFHDIDGDGFTSRQGQKVEVPRLWREIKESYNTVEYIDAQRGMGIGVVIL